MTILHAVVDAAHARDYGLVRELLATLTDDQVLAAKITLMAAAAQCDIIRYRPRVEPLPTGVQGYGIAGGTR
jgi:hypothetical protein